MQSNLKYIFIVIIASLSFILACGDKDIFDPSEQYVKETIAIDNYLDQNEIEASTEANSGLRYVIHDEGDSLKAETWDSVTVNYTIKLLSTGQEVATADSLKVKLDDQIIGWWVLLPLIKQGGSMTMYIPSYFAYGQLGASGIPGNTTIIVDVDLVEIHHLTTEEQLLYDQNRISNYILKNEIETVEDSVFGIKYTIIENGSGDKPSVTDNVNITYTGFILNDADLTTTQFDAQSRLTLALSELIQGWQIILPYMKEGGEIRMFLPSKYGYGTSKLSTSFPSNAILVFNVRLNSVQ